MKERPILFSADMVKAILDGIKTMTRRVINPQPTIYTSGSNISSLNWTHKPTETIIIAGSHSLDPIFQTILSLCPYGQVGDRLWVRETWLDYAGTPIYKADKSIPEVYHWKPSLFMPRWASRITLEITEVRVERVQEISGKDILAEGITLDQSIQEMDINGVYHDMQKGILHKFSPFQRCFQNLWDSLNAKRGYGWDTNCWVWVISFKKC